MNDLSLWDGLIGALIAAVIALVPSYFMWRAARAANRTAMAALEQAKQANEISTAARDEAQRANVAMDAANAISTAALEEARQSNEIAERAVEEARLARKIQHADWHRQAEPDIVVELGKGDRASGGYELKLSCSRDIDSGSITLVPGYDRAAVIGLGASPDEQVFTYGESVTLPALAAGATAVKGIWVGNAEGKTVQLRCEVTIGNDTWPIVRSVRFPVRAQVF